MSKDSKHTVGKLKGGDRVVTTKKLYVVGYSEDWMEAGAQGIVVGRPKTDPDYVTVKLDAVKLPTYIRETNLELVPAALEDLSFADGAMTVEYWGGNDLNAPEVRFCTKTYESKYDSYYDETHEILGDYDMTRDDMIKLRDFLNQAIDKSEGWVYRGATNKEGKP